MGKEANKGLNEPLDNISWYYDVGYSLKDRTVPKTVFACGVSPSFKWIRKNQVIELKRVPERQLNGTYVKWTSEADLPAWFKQGATVHKNRPVDGSKPCQMIQFGGSEKFTQPKLKFSALTRCLKLGKMSPKIGKGFNNHADEWYLSEDKKNCIFFDKIQNKWHICDEKTLYYRGNPERTPENIPNEANKGKKEALDNISWYSDPGHSLKGQCNKCDAKKVTPEDHKSKCDGTVTLKKKTVFASGMPIPKANKCKKGIKEHTTERKCSDAKCEWVKGPIPTVMC